MRGLLLRLPSVGSSSPFASPRVKGGLLLLLLLRLLLELWELMLMPIRREHALSLQTRLPIEAEGRVLQPHGAAARRRSEVGRRALLRGGLETRRALRSAADSQVLRGSLGAASLGGAASSKSVRAGLLLERLLASCWVLLLRAPLASSGVRSEGVFLLLLLLPKLVVLLLQKQLLREPFVEARNGRSAVKRSFSRALFRDASTGADPTTACRKTRRLLRGAFSFSLTTALEALRSGRLRRSLHATHPRLAVRDTRTCACTFCETQRRPRRRRRRLHCQGAADSTDLLLLLLLLLRNPFTPRRSHRRRSARDAGCPLFALPGKKIREANPRFSRLLRL